MICIFSLLLPCSWMWPKENTIMLTGLTLVMATNVKRAINAAPLSQHTTLVYLLNRWPRLNYVISPFSWISNTSSSKFIHLSNNQKKFHHQVFLYTTWTHAFYLSSNYCGWIVHGPMYYPHFCPDSRSLFASLHISPCALISIISPLPEHSSQCSHLLLFSPT